jgi:hypothetical protein
MALDHARIRLLLVDMNGLAGGCGVVGQAWGQLERGWVFAEEDFKGAIAGE